MDLEPVPLAKLPLRPMLGLVARAARRLIAPHEHWVGQRAVSGFVIGLAEAMAAGERIETDEVDAALDRFNAGTRSRSNTAADAALPALTRDVSQLAMDLLPALARSPRDGEEASALQGRFANTFDSWLSGTFKASGSDDHGFWRWAAMALDRDRRFLHKRLAAIDPDDPIGTPVESLSPTWLGELWPRCLAEPGERNRLDGLLQDQTGFARYRRVVEAATLQTALPDPASVDMLCWFIAGEKDRRSAIRQIEAWRKGWHGKAGLTPQLVAYVAGNDASEAARLAGRGVTAHVGAALGLPMPPGGEEVRLRLENSGLNAHAGWVGRPGDWFFGDVRIAWRDPAVVAEADRVKARAAVPLEAFVPLAPDHFSVAAGDAVKVVTKQRDRAAFAAMRQRR
jgi:hypothetical protein